MDRLTRGHIDDGGGHLESGVAQDLCCRIDVILAQISQQDALACADPPCNSLTDRAGTDDDDNIVHCDLLSIEISLSAYTSI
jgi:hypothetical protein